MLVLKRCIYECPCSPSLGKENSVFGTIKASVKLFEYVPKRIVVLMVLFKTFHDVDVRDACSVGHCRRPLWMWRRSWTAYKKLQRSSIMKVEAEKFQYWNHFSFFFFLKFGSSKGTIVASVGSCCGSVGRAVASNSRGPQFKSNHWHKFILIIYCQL